MINERKFRHRILSEMKEIRNNPPPVVRADWDIVWVLSGPQITFEEGEGDCNQTRNRLITGFNVAKKVAATRLDKSAEELTLEEIDEHAPPIYFNGFDEQNQNIRATAESGMLEENYGFSGSKLLVAGSEGIIRTPDNFKLFQTDLLESIRKIVLVTDAYHLPRTRRISETKIIDGEDNPVPGNKIIFYPSQPITFPFMAVRRDVGRITTDGSIASNIAKGYLRPEPET